MYENIKKLNGSYTFVKLSKLFSKNILLYIYIEATESSKHYTILKFKLMYLLLVIKQAEFSILITELCVQ
jgi:hypothetical protein